MQAPPRWCARTGTDAGFTLFELLVVIAVLAMMVAVVPPLVSGATTTAELKGAAREMAAALRYTRTQAIARNREAVFRLDIKTGGYQVSGARRTHILPKGLNLKLFAARSEFSNEHVGAIRFFPDGSSTGGRITVSHGKRNYEVDVNWLTGKVTIHG